MLLTKGRVVLAIVASGALLASHYAMYQWGHSGAAGDERTACRDQTIEQLTDMMSEWEKLSIKAGEQSRAIDRALNARRLADEQTTEELRDALAETNTDRADCLFPVGVMQQLAAARARAAQAAAGGVTGAVPAPERDD